MPVTESPLIPNGWGTADPSPVYYHEDGPIGTAVQHMGQEAWQDFDGEPLGDVLGKLATSVIDGTTSPEAAVRKFAAIRDRLPEDSRARQAMNLSLMDMDVPRGERATLPKDAPAPLHKLMATLNDTPMVRRDGKEIKALQQITDDYLSGRISSRVAAQEIQSRVHNVRHESLGDSGKFQIDKEALKAAEEMGKIRRSSAPDGPTRQGRRGDGGGPVDPGAVQPADRPLDKFLRGQAERLGIPPNPPAGQAAPRRALAADQEKGERELDAPEASGGGTSTATTERRALLRQAKALGIALERGEPDASIKSKIDDHHQERSNESTGATPLTSSPRTAPSATQKTRKDDTMATTAAPRTRASASGGDEAGAISAPKIDIYSTEEALAVMRQLARLIHVADYAENQAAALKPRLIKGLRKNGLDGGSWLQSKFLGTNAERAAEQIVAPLRAIGAECHSAAQSSHLFHLKYIQLYRDPILNARREMEDPDAGSVRA
jgi:hypothetical protein